MLLGGATVVYSLSAYAQQPRRIAVLMGIAEGDPDKARLDALRRGLASLGWKDVEYRFADGRLDHIAAYAEEFVRMAPDVRK